MTDKVHLWKGRVCDHIVEYPPDGVFLQTLCGVTLPKNEAVWEGDPADATCLDCSVAYNRKVPPAAASVTDQLMCAAEVYERENEQKRLAALEPLAEQVKESNPKDAIGSRKVAFSTVPAPVIAEIGLAMIEGACKYGRHNYRVIGVRSSVYYDAALRHLTAWWEGEDVDRASGLSHITKALSSLTVLRDAMINNKLADDRPPPVPLGWIEGYNREAERIIDAAPRHVPPYTKGNAAPGCTQGQNPNHSQIRD